MLGLQRNESVERGVGEQPPLFESFSEHEAVSITRRQVWQPFSANVFAKQKIRTPVGVLVSTEIIYAAAVREIAVLRSTEVSTFATSLVGHTSLAPASSAAIHISSSGMRWVQTIGRAGKSRCKFSTSIRRQCSMLRTTASG